MSALFCSGCPCGPLSRTHSLAAIVWSGHQKGRHARGHAEGRWQDPCTCSQHVTHVSSSASEGRREIEKDNDGYKTAKVSTVSQNRPRYSVAFFQGPLNASGGSERTHQTSYSSRTCFGPSRTASYETQNVRERDSLRVSEGQFSRAARHHPGTLIPTDIKFRGLFDEC